MSVKLPVHAVTVALSRVPRQHIPQLTADVRPTRGPFALVGSAVDGGRL